MFPVMAGIYFFDMPDTGRGFTGRFLHCQREAGSGVLSHVVDHLLPGLAGGGA